MLWEVQAWQILVVSSLSSLVIFKSIASISKLQSASHLNLSFLQFIIILHCDKQRMNALGLLIPGTLMNHPMNYHTTICNSPTKSTFMVQWMQGGILLIWLLACAIFYFILAAIIKLNGWLCASKSTLLLDDNIGVLQENLIRRYPEDIQHFSVFIVSSKSDCYICCH